MAKKEDKKEDKKKEANQDVELQATEETAKPKGKQPKYSGKVSFLSLFRFTTWTERLMLLFGVIGGLGHGLIQPLFMLTFGNLIDSFQATNSGGSIDDAISQFNGFILIMVYLAIAAFVGSYFRTAMFVHVGNSVANQVRREYLTAIFRQEISWFDSKKTGELTARIANDVPLIRDATSEKVGQLCYSLSLFIAGYAISFSTCWKIALVVLAGTPVLIVTVAVIGRFLTMYSTKGQKIYAEAGSIAQEILSAIKTVIVFGGQSEEEQRYNKALEVCENNGVRKSFVEAFSTSTPFLVGFCLYALALWYGATLAVSEGITAGKVFVSFICVTMSSTALGMMAPPIMTISIGRGAAYEIYQVIDRKSQIDGMSEAGLKPETCKGELSFKDVKFTYPSRPDIKILKGISFDVPSGKTVALVGKSGSGKSTIIALLERFYNPDEGSISLDGAPLDQLNVKWLRSRIGLVGQEPVLFAGTVAENISICKPDATMEEITQAAMMANAHDFISQLPDGYNTTVFQRGGNLSGGQKQRIAIARALLKNPQILLLDEATSALDSKSESVVQQALEKASLGRSTLVVAHRLSTIRNADRILVFDKGEIIEQGNHDELMALNGEYSKLVQLQSVATKQEKQETEEEKSERKNTMIKEQATSDLQQEYQEGKKKKQKVVTTWYILKKVFSNHYRNEGYLNVIGIIAGVGQGLCFPAFSFVFTKILIALMLDTTNELQSDVNQWCIGLVCVGAIAMVIVYTQNITFLISGERLTKRLRAGLFSNVIRQKGEWFDFKGREPAVFETILAQDASIMHKMSGKLLGQFVKILSVIGGSIGLGAYFCWRLALVVLACVPLSAFGNYLKVRSIKGFAVETRKAYEKSGVVAAEGLENIRTVLSLGLEPHFIGLFNKEILEPETTGRRDAQMHGLGFGYGEAIQLLIYAMGFWYGGKQILDGNTGIEGMLVTVMSIINMGLVIGDTLHIFPDFQQALSAGEAYYDLMVQEPEMTGKLTGVVPESCNGQVTFKDVRFAYPTRPDTDILKGLSISVQPGQTLAFVGHSGCGKSTTISILERLYSFSSGSVLLDGVDIRQVDLAWLRQQMGYVGQEPLVFARSIRENIAYGCPNVSDEDIKEAVRKSNAEEFLSRLPDGLNTYVGERGTQLSGGQKQRIAIARALIRNPKILLLDEATSALDSESEKLVQQAINEARKGRTTIVIAHRLSTIKDADIIAVVDKGQVVEYGTHNDLIELKGHYFNFVKAQSLEGN